jgi:prophage tail gpP-like protein
MNANENENLVMDWNELSVPAREEICQGAGFQLHIAARPWAEIDEWARSLLSESIERRTNGQTILGEWK